MISDPGPYSDSGDSPGLYFWRIVKDAALTTVEGDAAAVERFSGYFREFEDGHPAFAAALQKSMPKRKRDQR
jgi:hypothetical protein